MTVSPVKKIIAAEIEDRKVKLGSFELKIDEKLDESIYQGMQTASKAIHLDKLTSHALRYMINIAQHRCYSP